MARKFSESAKKYFSPHDHRNLFTERRLCAEVRMHNRIWTRRSPSLVEPLVRGISKEAALDIFERIARMKYDDDISSLQGLGAEIKGLNPDQFEIVTV